jgi:hypothetical protein
MKALVKVLAHAAVDAAELSNEFVLRTLKRTGFLQWYMRGTFRSTELLIALMDVVESSVRRRDPGPILAFRLKAVQPLFKGVDVEEIVRLALSSVRDASTPQSVYLHEAIERGTLIFDTFGDPRTQLWEDDGSMELHEASSSTSETAA